MKYILVFFLLLFSLGVGAQTKKQEIKKLKTENDSLMRVLTQEREQNNRNQLQCEEKLQSNEYALRKLTVEGETLRKIMKSYIHTIDSLYTEYKTLDAILKKQTKN